MLDMNLQRFANQNPTLTTIIPNGLPDKPGPKLVSAKGNVERLVVVLENDDNLKAATKRVLDDGNVPAVVVNNILMTWNIDSYIGIAFESSTTTLGAAVGKFNDQGKLNVTGYVVTSTPESNKTKKKGGGINVSSRRTYEHL